MLRIPPLGLFIKNCLPCMVLGPGASKGLLVCGEMMDWGAEKVLRMPCEGLKEEGWVICG